MPEHFCVSQFFICLGYKQIMVTKYTFANRQSFLICLNTFANLIQVEKVKAKLGKQQSVSDVC